MKRSPIKPGKPLARKSSLSRVGAAGRRRKADPRDRVSEATIVAVRARQGGLCACGCGRPIAPFPIGYHHVFPKAKWPSLIDVAGNLVGVSAQCHASHETAARRLPRSAVACAEIFAATPQMRRYLDAVYGPKESSVPPRTVRRA